MTSDPRVPFAADAFPQARGDMSGKVRRFDWSATPLGPIDRWPGSLGIAVEMVLASHFPKCLVWGPQRVTIYNDAFLPILGGKPEALGRSFLDVWHEVRDALAPIVDKAFAGEATYIEDFPLRIERSGLPEDAWFTFCYSPVRDEQGRIVGMVDTVIETTGKVLAQRQADEFNRSLAERVAATTAERDEMWQLATDVMAVFDRDGRVVAGNPAWTTLLGWRGTQLEGRDFGELLHPDDRAATAIRLNVLAAQGGTARFESRSRHRDGSFRSIAWTAVSKAGRTHAVGRDMTAEHESSAALRRSEAALTQSQKMESIGQLTGGVAHDFNNLLQVVSSNLHLLSNVCAGDARAERYLSGAVSAVRRGAKLTSQLLAFARRQPLEPKVVNVGRFVSGMDELLRRALGEAIETETVVSGGLWNCLVDPGQVENALLNLAINARDAMLGSGRLTIEVGNASLDAGYALLNPDAVPGQYVMLAVTDTGSGMPAEVVAKAFDPFFTTKSEGKGSGLGLSMVYGFVKQSGGHVKIYSEPGHGTTVKLYLPRVMEAEAPQGTTAGERVVERGSETLLVAEDDAEVRAATVELLEQAGYRVLQAQDAASAIAIIEGGVHVDLLFTDVVMPGPVATPELARRAVQKLPGLVVLFTSGYTQNAIVHGGRLDVGVELLGKPYSAEAVTSRIRQLLDRRPSPATADPVPRP